MRLTVVSTGKPESFKVVDVDTSEELESVTSISVSRDMEDPYILRVNISFNVLDNGNFRGR